MASSSSTPTSLAALTTKMENLTTAPTLLDLQTNRTLWYKVHVFVYDLRNFREIPTSQERLDRIVDASYIGTPYFTDDEAQLLKATIVQDDKNLEQVIEETLKERLEKRIKKRVESGDYRVCAAHDLAPIFENAFGIKPKELAKNQDFLAVLSRSCLKLKEDDEWEGSPKKQFQKKNKKKKR